MIPDRILRSFSALPEELTGLCRPHSWAELTTPPGEGMRSIRDILVHMMGAEYSWIQTVVLRAPRRRYRPEEFEDLDAILSVWRPQREATVALAAGLSPAEASSRRPFPWDPTQTASVEEIIWHVVTHEQYHRGQVFTRLALLGRQDLPDQDLLR